MTKFLHQINHEERERKGREGERERESWIVVFTD
jgi:hypothetical protein